MKNKYGKNISKSILKELTDFEIKNNTRAMKWIEDEIRQQIAIWWSDTEIIYNLTQYLSADYKNSRSFRKSSWYMFMISTFYIM